MYQKITKEIKNNYFIYIILIIYIILLSITISYHEPWADEAQAWLLARDNSISDLLIKYLPYEGHPGLWHLILMVPAKLGFPYFTISIISGIIATIGVYIFLRYSPFPKIIKILFPFSYFIFYQYAVIARNYVLFPLLLFSIAAIYKEKTKKISLFIFLLILLANAHAIGFFITLLLLFIHLIDIIKKRNYLNKKLIKKQIKSYFLAFITMGLIIIQMIPPRDSVWRIGPKMIIFSKFIKLRVLNESLTANWSISFILLFILLFWFWQKRKLLIYLMTILICFCFFSIIAYKEWHQGIIFLILFFVMWVSFESKENRIKLNSQYSKILKNIVIISLVFILLIQINWAVSASINDYKGQYSAGKEIADYIKENNLEDKKIYATTFWSISIQPYFKENIFDNFNNEENITFWIWSTKNNVIEDYNQIIKDQPDLIIFRGFSKREIKGYKFIGIFKGNVYWKKGTLERNHFIVFQKEEIE